MTGHQVTAHLTPGASSIVIDGVDVSTAVTKAGTRLHFDAAGRPVLTLQTVPGMTIDLTAEAEVRVEPARQLSILDRLAARGIRGDDALSSVDYFIAKAVAHVMRGTEDLPAAERDAYLTRVFGSDAARVAACLLAPASSDSAVDELRARLQGDGRG